MENYKIAAVSYINTFPFVYGIEKSGILSNYELVLDVPSACANLIINNKVDIALVPVAALPKIRNCQIITNYCISATEDVSTVLLVSNVPIQQINAIALDNDSLTSVNLIKVLCQNHWKINPEWIQLNDFNQLKNYESALVIGDKSIDAAKNFKYIYDLSTEWYIYSGLPFVFACWVAKPNIESQFLTQLDKALHFGINNKEKALKQYKKSQSNDYDWLNYLNNKIDFNLDTQKFKSIELFLNYLTNV